MDLEMIRQIQDIVGNAVVIAGLLFMSFGIVGIFKFKDFYPRILVTSKIDTVGMITVVFGLMIKNGISFFTGKLLLILIILLVLTPLVAHLTARSAYTAGHQTPDDDAKSGSDITKELEENL